MSALSEIRVLELAEGVAGEYCGKLLSDFGAEVIKVEPPEGSPTRRCGPFAGEHSGLFAYLNTNKSSVVLDRSTPSGKSTLSKLLERVDVVVDDHAPGWLASIGLGLDTLETNHSNLVVCSITAYGQSPPDDRLHAEDLNVFHSSGWGYHTPSAADATAPPLKGAGRYLVSYEAGLDAALCIAAAVYERLDSQLGRWIDISKQRVMASRVDYVLGQMVGGDIDVSSRRSAFDLGGPASFFRCRDGYVYLWISAPAHWQGLRKLLGAPSWMDDFSERWLELDCTPERVATCRQHLGEWLLSQDKESVSEAAQQQGVTMVAVNGAADLQRSPQYVHRGFFSEVGSKHYPTVPYLLSATPARIHSASPLLGQHTAETGRGRT
ncbi:MAG TPA: CoA transferase [Steroidobacter sp.]